MTDPRVEQRFFERLERVDAWVDRASAFVHGLIRPALIFTAGLTIGRIIG